MLKRLLCLAVVIGALASGASAVTSQVQFIATLQDVETLDGGLTVLTVELTPSISIPVMVSEDTEIRDENELPATAADLAPGLVVKIRGVFAPGGILALEIEIQEDGSEFEVRGLIQGVSVDGSGAGVIRVSDIEIEVPSGTQIVTRQGDRRALADLAVGQFAKVEGKTQGGRFIADRITVQEPERRFARIRIEGVVTQILSDFEFTVALEGAVSAQVEIDEETEVRGTLAVGALVRVEGYLTETLAVRARLIVVVDSVRLAPRELEMGLGETREVAVILTAPRDEDTVFQLSSGDPEVAAPGVDSITVPAGELTAGFQVFSGDREGETNILVSTEGFRGRVKVKVQDEGEDEPGDEPPPMADLRLRWEPRVIHATGNRGVREVRLRVNERADEDIMVAISQESGDADFISYPSMVIIPAGSKEVRLEISFLKDQGDAVLRAVLPEAFGGDDDELEISLRPVKTEKLEIEWEPDEVALRPGESGEAELRLDRPAPYDLEVVLSLKSGNRSLISGLPARVQVPEGASRVQVSFSAGGHPGKVRLRAALPLQLGGDQDELEIEVKR